MNRKRIYMLDEKEWKPTREDLTEKVSGISLIPTEWTNHKFVLTKVEPGGEFSNHTDPYHHVFYYINGQGIGWIGDQTYEIKPDLIVEVPSGMVHGYKNNGAEDLILLTMNIPKT